METNPRFEALQLLATPDISISGILGIPEWWPSGHRIGVVLAHDVGTNMDQELVVWLQHQLVDRGFLTIRFNFPYAEQGRKRPDPPAILEKAYRAAIAGLVRDPQDTPAQTVFAGVGLGARVSADVIASGAKADALLTLAYPLHPAGKPSQQRADSLFRIICPILFVQGTRDSHCRIDRLQLLLRRVGAPTTLAAIEDADHSLEPVKRGIHSQEEIRAQTLAAILTFLQRSTGAVA
jgi:predicted alpha/beta-hydrolase family hydrolase